MALKTIALNWFLNLKEVIKSYKQVFKKTLLSSKSRLETIKNYFQNKQVF